MWGVMILGVRPREVQEVDDEEEKRTQDRVGSRGR